jgi:hypothetical protein
MPNETYKHDKVIHLSMIVVNKTLITGADDGSVFVWKS